MREIALLLVAVVVVLGKPLHKQDWYKLEKEVKFTPRPESFRDSLEKHFEITRPDSTPQVACKLPQYDKAVYHLKWGPLNVGYGYVENKRNGDILLNIGKAVTSGLVGNVLKVRDFVWSYGDANGLFPWFFQQDMYEDGLSKDKYVRNKWNTYNHKEGIAYNWNGKKLKTKDADPFTNNYLTLLYNLRNSDFKVGDTITYPCFVHKKHYQLKSIVRKKEKIKVPAGTFHCWKIQPVLVGEGHGFNEKDKMYLWIDRKFPHLMVRADADARLGKVRAKLKYYKAVK